MCLANSKQTCFWKHTGGIHNRYMTTARNQHNDTRPFCGGTITGTEQLRSGRLRGQTRPWWASPPTTSTPPPRAAPPACSPGTSWTRRSAQTGRRRWRRRTGARRRALLSLSSWGSQRSLPRPAGQTCWWRCHRSRRPSSLYPRMCPWSWGCRPVSEPRFSGQAYRHGALQRYPESWNVKHYTATFDQQKSHFNLTFVCMLRS